MKDKDSELEKLLSPLKDLEPGELRLRKWTQALETREKIRARRSIPPYSLAAAVLLGVILGALGMRHLGRMNPSALENRQPAATLEYSIVNPE